MKQKLESENIYVCQQQYYKEDIEFTSRFFFLGTGRNTHKTGSLPTINLLKKSVESLKNFLIKSFLT